jgi:RNA polymerase sigma-70 factor (ECF subfamily)
MERATPSDEALIEAVAEGDEAALVMLYDRYAKAVFSLAARITQDQGLAEEITQEVFLRLWRNAATFTAGRGRFASWLLGVAHHLAVDQLRRRRARPQAVASTDDLQVQGIADLRTDVEEEAWLRVRREMMLEALARLPEAQRQVIELAYFGGLTHVEIAARLGDPLGTVKTRMRLGLLKLRELLQAQGLEVTMR